MLKKLSVRNFTVFAAADLECAAGLNVIVGGNGTGKSHLLKLAYTVLATLAEGERGSGSDDPTKGYLATALARKLTGVFRPDQLGRLASRQQGRSRCEVKASFKDRGLDTGFSFNSSSKTEVSVDRVPDNWSDKKPVFLPTRELLTIAPGFAALYANSQLKFEETWRDTCELLEVPLARGPRLETIKPLLEPLEEQLGGKVVEGTSGGFYLKTADGTLEAHLLAEGVRKLAMLARLIASGSLTGKGCLFWDEPEANLNPKVVKKVAVTILQLCQAGVQVFVATHSLFLMRELDLLLKQEEFKGVAARFTGLHPADDGVRVDQGATVDEIGEIDALQEELSQSDRYLAAEAD